MFVAVLKKDLSLLRNYWRSAAVATIVCYAIAAVFVVWLTEYQDESMQQIGARSFLVLGVGSRIGMVVTVIFTVALAGSVFTLERSDRSAEFLACLPPTRLMNLVKQDGNRVWCGAADDRSALAGRIDGIDACAVCASHKHLRHCRREWHSGISWDAGT